MLKTVSKYRSSTDGSSSKVSGSNNDSNNNDVNEAVTSSKKIIFADNRGGQLAEDSYADCLYYSERNPAVQPERVNGCNCTIS